MNLTRILVPTDFSPAADSALDAALTLARKTGARVTVLHVCELPPYSTPGLGMFVPSPELERDIADDVERRLAELRRRYEGRGVDIETRRRVGLPAEEIVDCAEAEGCDLVVIGSHGRHGWKRFVLGSVAERVVRNASVPVMTVRDMAQAATHATA